MRDTNYDDYDDYNHNDFSGDAENVVQARDVHGGINYYDRDYGTFEYQIFPYAGLIYYFALFVAASTYSHLWSNMTLGIFDWIKIVISTCVLVGAFLTTHSWIFNNPSFRFLRFTLALIVILVGYNQGERIEPLLKLNETISGWLIWQF